jgi:hypothetical protein
MSKEFGTVSVRRGDRAREIEILRQQYGRHRDTLASLAADAPTEHLASEYARLIREIDTALGKLGELEGQVPSDTQPGTRPLITPPGMINPDVSEPAEPGSALPRVALIIAAGVVVLALIAWLMWRASEPTPTPVVRERVETGPVTPAPKPVPIAASLAVDPRSHDYGTIRKGTRAVRQFQVTNKSDESVTLNVERSACRCLYYDYAGPISPHGKEIVTVTVDGAKAKSGPLHEIVSVSSKKDPAVSASFEVKATIR